MPVVQLEYSQDTQVVSAVARRMADAGRYGERDHVKGRHALEYQNARTVPEEDDTQQWIFETGPIVNR